MIVEESNIKIVLISLPRLRGDLASTNHNINTTIRRFIRLMVEWSN